MHQTEYRVSYPSINRIKKFRETQRFDDLKLGFFLMGIGTEDFVLDSSLYSTEEIERIPEEPKRNSYIRSCPEHNCSLMQMPSDVAMLCYYGHTIPNGAWDVVELTSLEE